MGEYELAQSNFDEIEFERLTRLHSNECDVSVRRMTVRAIVKIPAYTPAAGLVRGTHR